jgi:glycosyltransferase involved in cell wall biosynthesis
VVLEAFASGVPAVVTDAGGPKFIVRNGVSGFVARSDEDFIACTARLLNDSDLRRRMSAAARLQASAESWDEVFDKVYDGYTAALPAKTLNVPSY